MKILSMTATFGKLERQTLTLKPDLNIIQAPNEWGKSTWCAFLTAMLYGIDTSQRTTQTMLSDKEHYAPWSGRPMSGRLELFWKGKEITIERSTKGRIPMGEFSAYETQSGLPLPELTAANCGQMLLGVERSVFLRAGFIKQSDMPVTQDEALRRRLNALVTTGNENDAADRLAEKLKDLKNRCRHNKTGALPQTEAKRAQLAAALLKLSNLRTQLRQINQNKQLLQQQLSELQNHQLTLDYDNAQEGLYRLTAAQTVLRQTKSKVEQLQAQAKGLPARQEAALWLEQLRSLMGEKNALDNHSQQNRTAPELFSGMTPEAAVQQARGDKNSYDQALRNSPVLLFLAFLCCTVAIGISFLWVYGLLLLLPAAICLGMHLYKTKQKKNIRAQLLSRYGTLSPEDWIPVAEAYQAESAVMKAQQTQLAAWTEKLQALTKGLSPEAAAEKWQSILALYDELDKARVAMQQAVLRESDLRATVKSASPPAQADKLTLSSEETAMRITQVTGQLQQLQLQAGQCLGQIDALGQEDSLQQQLEAVELRIRKLEDLYEASVLALAYLEQATLQLQQRFAPQLTARAKALFSLLTGGRYDRLQLDQQLQLQTATENENSLRAARWRSDGTMDQLYLALRLAVAEHLTPEAPLVLDDALVRFDDTRHSAAMEVLTQLAADKQVILFTCQPRESAYSPNAIIEI